MWNVVINRDKMEESVNLFSSNFYNDVQSAQINTENSYRDYKISFSTIEVYRLQKSVFHPIFHMEINRFTLIYNLIACLDIVFYCFISSGFWIMSTDISKWNYSSVKYSLFLFLLPVLVLLVVQNYCHVINDEIRD